MKKRGNGTKVIKETVPGGPGKATPLSMRERARLRPRLGDPEWFNTRRDASPAKGTRKLGNGVIVPQRLLKGGRALVNQSFVPPEAEVFPFPRFSGRPPERILRRFSGEKVTPVNHTFLFDGDDRKLYEDSSYPWCCIGQVSCRNGNSTGTLAGKNFFVTASHAVAGLWQNGQPLTESITFVPAMFGGSSLLGPAWTAKVINIAAWDEVTDVVGYDMAICQLDQPFGEWLGYFGTRSYDEDWEDNPWWEHAGYPYDLSPGGDEPCYQFNITIEDDDDDDHDTLELETNADIASGQSGGPLWAIFNDGGHQIIGVLSGNQDSTWEFENIFAGGSGLNALVKWGRDNWK